jgi:monoamine oxidase
MSTGASAGIPRVESDFVVVGAGFAGLTAAWRLSKHGSVIVLEARDRVGGRVFTGHLPDGTWLDFGGTWFGPDQKHAYALAAEMGIGTYPTYTKGDAALVLADGKVVWHPGDITPEELCNLVGSAAVSGPALAAFVSMYEQVPPELPWTAPSAHHWDRQTYAAWVDAQRDGEDASLLQPLFTLMEGFFCCDPAEYSLLGALYLIRSHEGILRITGIQGGDQQDRICGGAQSIANEIHRRLGGAVRLSSPVRRITQHGDGVEVVADTVVVRAKRAVVAMPPAVSGRIQYEPPLPAARAMLTERVPFGEIIKVLIAYENAFWRQDGRSGSSTAVADPIGITFDGCTDAEDPKPGLLIAFAFGHHARALSLLSQEDRRNTILGSLAKRFGPQAATPIDGGYFEHDWSTDPWSGGGMIAHFPPGVLTNFGPALREPTGFIHWAGSESSSAFHCSINAAIESGERVCREIVASLGGAAAGQAVTVTA